MSATTHLDRRGYKSPILSEATVHNGVVYCAGKVGLDPIKGTLVSDDVGEQTASSMDMTACYTTDMVLGSNAQSSQNGSRHCWK